MLKYLPTKLKWPSGWLKTDQSPLESTQTVCSSTVAVYRTLGKFSVVLEALITESSLSVTEWPSIPDSRKRFLIGLSKTAGEPNGANKATIVYTEEMAHVESTRWLLQQSSTDFNINLRSVSISVNPILAYTSYLFSVFFFQLKQVFNLLVPRPSILLSIEFWLAVFVTRLESLVTLNFSIWGGNLSSVTTISSDKLLHPLCFNEKMVTFYFLKNCSL